MRWRVRSRPVYHDTARPGPSLDQDRARREGYPGRDRYLAKTEGRSETGGGPDPSVWWGYCRSSLTVTIYHNVMGASWGREAHRPGSASYTSSSRSATIRTS